MAKAQAGVTIAEKSYQRIKNLYEQGVMPAQKLDEVTAQRDASIATEKAAKAQYTMAKNGAEREDKMAAEALVNRAKGAVAEVESYIKETYLIAPAAGEVSEIFPKVGELVGTGAPIMNIAELNDMWVTFNVREDLLKNRRWGRSSKLSFLLWIIKDPAQSILSERLRHLCCLESNQNDRTI